MRWFCVLFQRIFKFRMFRDLGRGADLDSGHFETHLIPSFHHTLSWMRRYFKQSTEWQKSAGGVRASPAQAGPGSPSAFPGDT